MSTSGRTPPDTAAVTDGAVTLITVLAAAREQGFDGELQANTDATVSCGRCHATPAATEFTVQGVQRLEGASDAADLLLVATADCPACGRGGALVLGYGPNASEADAAVVADIDLGRTSPVVG